jgi:hypothetical protein
MPARISARLLHPFPEPLLHILDIQEGIFFSFSKKKSLVLFNKSVDCFVVMPAASGEYASSAAPRALAEEMLV